MNHMERQYILENFTSVEEIQQKFDSHRTVESIYARMFSSSRFYRDQMFRVFLRKFCHTLNINQDKSMKNTRVAQQLCKSTGKMLSSSINNRVER